MMSKEVTDIVVLLDREDRQECPGQLAGEILDNLEIPPGCFGFVVIKDRMFENWLVADVATLRKFPGRYALSAADERRIVPDGADKLDALRIMKGITSPSYAKVSDSRKIMEAADPMAVAANSRSFRRLLRVLGAPPYENQSRRAST
jgi:hypothetical protein